MTDLYTFGPSSCAPDELNSFKSKTYQTITRKGTFDSGHRVMNEKMKCFNVHGHTYLYELTFKFQTMESIGYAIDFKEIKRVGCQWIDDMFDHGMLINPKDQNIITMCNSLESKKWIMSLNGKDEYCNPTVENIAKEIFLGLVSLLNSKTLKLERVRLYETPNCFTDCFANSISMDESKNFMRLRGKELDNYKQEKGVLEYDDRK
jgi:6-pyruvoyltetrahydropterin/6-carboxytetrahydropterin synthase